MIVPYLGVQETLRRSSDVAMAAPAGQGRWMQSTVGFGGYPEPWTASKGPGSRQGFNSVRATSQHTRV